MRLNEAISIASEMHDGQKDKSGAPYILHLLRVMLAVHSEPERVVAVLHDVAEDHEDGWKRVKDWCDDPAILDAIDALTRRHGETYEAYIERAKANKIAHKVKIADIKDNLAPERLSGLNETLKQRYINALAVLL